MIVLEAENISKQYRLGNVGTGTIKDDLGRFWARIRGKEDPYLLVGEENDRTFKGDSNYVWALRDIDFQVNQGDVLGIVGKNGAGKSTLLKILSRVTGPTTGQVRAKGRIASLLEVGTGFHKELTGRENVYLNGAILGMTKAEIKSKFDEIVAFSGVERYIDTPVKRYSSGMYVRLAFAVAAHLEAEILIVDEVLAVGDVDFQKQCLGKMKEVAGTGRTVLFVSHNLSAVRDLCTRALLIEKGQTVLDGTTLEVIDRYLKGETDMSQTGVVPPSYVRQWGTLDAKIKQAELLNEVGEVSTNLFFRERISIKIHFEVEKPIQDVMATVRIATLDGIVTSFGDSYSMSEQAAQYGVGEHTITFEMDTNFNPGSYALYVSLAHCDSGKTIDYVERILDFQIQRNARDQGRHFKWNSANGYFELDGNWKL